MSALQKASTLGRCGVGGILEVFLEGDFNFDLEGLGDEHCFWEVGVVGRGGGGDLMGDLRDGGELIFISRADLFGWDYAHNLMKAGMSSGSESSAVER